MPSSDQQLRQGDVVVVPFPYADQLAEKRRPALIVSGKSFNKRHGLVWVAMITSAENEAWDGDIPVTLKGSGLTSASVIRPAKIATIDPARVIRVAGKLDAATCKTVKAAISAALD